MIGVFVGFLRLFLLGILIFKGLIARRLYKSFGVKGSKRELKMRYEQVVSYLNDPKWKPIA
jgi:hypothetical protein